MAWLLLALAITSEVLATTALKLSDGFTHLGWSIVVAAGYITSFALLARVLKLQLDMGTAYAVWSGAGTAAIALIGAAFMGETLTALKIGGILLIIGGVVLLNLAGGH
ncbi:DMT family transporter [Nonomuraea gerenzanensis]|uniref:Ethidium bromide-methyl viologen resistance protein EmrE n=1 Tax=Nonomuraea gerenzanensis TaxID=93944 RepID=A0A1M4EC80_9ACTN|nr:multidrug efflux SMR transporter [Nonomuraea gerenzanensis]UBU18646.1 multidrug efflux SMR transporter [Nonomuraea gerenzanensis]SBO96499.1 Ethidium bromide-methyl viologen resistance protein EmrE [Nonomuraea gerenzanensis]